MFSMTYSLAGLVGLLGPVVDVNRPGIGRVGVGEKYHKGRGKLEPAKDLRLVRELQELGNGLVRCFHFR